MNIRQAIISRLRDTKRENIEAVIEYMDLSTYLCTTSGPICSFCTIFLKPQRDCSKMHFATIPLSFISI